MHAYGSTGTVSQDIPTSVFICPVDFILEPLPLKLYFAAGEQELTVTLSILNTSIVEAGQLIVIQLYTNISQIIIPPETQNATIPVKEQIGRASCRESV